MAVRHLGELKKKKNPIEPELKSRFTNPPTSSAYISPKPQSLGDPQTYAKSLRGSRGPGSRRLLQHRGAGGGPATGGPSLGFGARWPGISQAPASTPGRSKSKPQGFQGT